MEHPVKNQATGEAHDAAVALHSPAGHEAPLAETLRIVLLGLRNAGKSSLMNRLFEREVSIVSPQPGTTTDVVTRKIELPGFGAAAITDTAGLDDEGELGAQRIRASRLAAEQASIRVLVTPIDRPPTNLERAVLTAARPGTKTVIALSYADAEPDPGKVALVEGFPTVRVENATGAGAGELRTLLAKLAAEDPGEIGPMEGLLEEGDLVLLVTPIDLAAPKGRLIMPQVETIRDILDRDCAALVVKERELHAVYGALGKRPKLVVTDSQAFHSVAADIPEDQPLTSFSILFARKKGELEEFVRGVKEMEWLPEAPKVLVMESCSHHRQATDIGTVKIPRLLRRMLRPKAEVSFARCLPDEAELTEYDLVIHCAGCMITRKKMTARIERLRKRGILVTNYGLFLAWTNGLLPRAIEPFPEIAELYRATP